MVGGVIGLATASKGGGSQYKAALAAWKKLETSNFDFRALDPPELRVLAEQMPEIYSAVVPEEFQQVADSAQGRAGQVSSLGQLQEIAREGMPLVDRLQAQQAGQAVTSAASAANRDALRRIASRGQLGTGDEIQASIAANQGTANLSRDIANDLAVSGANRRMSAIGSAGDAASRLRAGDVDVNARNAEIANRFATMFSQMKTQEAADAAASRERAGAYNTQTRQAIGNANTTNRYQAALENLNRQNALRGQQFGQNLAKTQGLSNAYNTYGGYKDAVRNSQIQAATNIGSGVGGIGDSLLGGGI